MPCLRDCYSPVYLISSAIALAEQHCVYDSRILGVGKKLVVACIYLPQIVPAIPQSSVQKCTQSVSTEMASTRHLRLEGQLPLCKFKGNLGWCKVLIIAPFLSWISQQLLSAVCNQTSSSRSRKLLNRALLHNWPAPLGALQNNCLASALPRIAREQLLRDLDTMSRRAAEA